MAKRNFLLSKGELLTSQIIGSGSGGEKNAPYTFEEAQQRLQPMLDKVAAKIFNLPADSCPDDYAVASITLNPEYIAKSYYPGELFRTVGIEAIGSKGRRITPEKRSISKENVERPPVETLTTQLFVVGKRNAFANWAQSLSAWSELADGAGQIIEIEEIAFPEPSDKIIASPLESAGEKVLYEVVLHLNEDNGESRFLGKFQEYLQKLDLNPDFSKRFYAGGLCFVELEAPQVLAEKIAEFSLVRVLRKMPGLRLIRPEGRNHGRFFDKKIDLPDCDPLDPNTKVAIFDGGIPDDHPICRWVTPYETEGLIAPDPDNLQHGISVTSAFLFGHIDPKSPLPQPYAYVDHYRVMDVAPGQNPRELFDILERIKDVLATKKYDFINLSLGPSLPIEDDEVHAWTAVLDEYLSDGTTLATIAVGNEGEGDAEIGANRIQVPADCVNALAIGACDSPGDKWARASYSSVGPGRSPGLVKPDLVDFGGDLQHSFLTLHALDGNKLFGDCGTSFSAPSTLRLGCGVRTHFGNSLNALAIRALLVHCSETSDTPRFEIGWGRVARHLEDIVVCQDHVMRVVFQGRLTASKFIRAPIPLPDGTLKGKIKVTATLVYATPCDPHHSGNYTRSGLDVFFRPNNTKKNKPLPGKSEPIHAATKPFFSSTRKAFQTEEELRRDAWKWENCQHATNNFLSSTLVEPSFDIHYNARLEGRSDNRSQELLYALVVTVEAPRVKDLYDQVVRKYARSLQQLRPVIDVPVKITGA